MKYAITIYSKYTGEYKKLGYQFDTRKEAEKFAEEEICSRCNRFEVNCIGDGKTWIDSKRGFLPIKEVKE